MRGDTLSSIAGEFGLTVGQLLAANPSITDANLIQVGQVLIIPPPGAPDTGPSVAELADVRDDITDPNGDSVAGQSYIDITGVGARHDGARRVAIEFLLIHAPPQRLDPDVEVVSYTVEIDTEGDGQPDYRLVYANDAQGQGRFMPSIEDRTSGRIRTGNTFPGEVEVTERALRFRVNRAAFGTPRSYRMAFKVEREFYPNGTADPTVESSVDYAPEQQWPRPNAQWMRLAGV
jgi:LysM repeat protein